MKRETRQEEPVSIIMLIMSGLPVPINGSGADTDDVIIQVLTFNPGSPNNDRITGFVESSGYVAIDTEHYMKNTVINDISWEKIYDYGRTQSSMKVFPTTASSVNPPDNSPCLEYDDYIFNPGKLTVTTDTAPSLNINPEHGLRFGISFDEEPPVIVDTFRTNQDGFYTDNEWSTAVMDNICLKKTTHAVKSEGNHTLKIWMVDPGIVLQKIVINTRGEKKSYVGPPEDGIAAYTFYAGGNVRIWVLLQAPTPEADSLFIKLGDDKWMTWDNIEGAAKNPAWVVWRDFKKLPDDIHTLQIARREGDIKIDQILITNDLDFIPPQPPTPLNIEAESASGQSMFSPFEVKSNTNASGTITLTALKGIITYDTSDGK